MLPTFFTRHLSDNFFENEFFDYSSLGTPRSEVTREDDSWKISISLIGFSKDDINIETAANTICVSGEISDNDIPKFVNQTKFKKTWELKDLDADSVEAKLENGILHITLKKLEDNDSAKRKVDIK